MTQGVAANNAPHFAPSPAFVRLVRNSKPSIDGVVVGASRNRWFDDYVDQTIERDLLELVHNVAARSTMDAKFCAAIAIVFSAPRQSDACGVLIG